MKRWSRFSLLAVAVLAFGAAQAEDVKVFRPGQFNEKDLVNALVPQESLTRSIRLSGVVAPSPPPAQGQAGSAAAPVLIRFATNSAGLTPQARADLDVIGRALAGDQLAGFQFGIEGHTDPRGTAELNQALSQSRAESVSAYLASAHKIDPARLKPVGKGFSELLRPELPLSPDNRRVTIKTLIQ